MGIVTDKTHFTLAPHDISQVVHVIFGHELVLNILLLLRHLHKRSQINLPSSTKWKTYFFPIAFKEALIEAKHSCVNVFQHLAHFASIDDISVLVSWLLSERFSNIHTKSLFQKDVTNYPVCFFPCLKVLAVKWCHSQELKHLILVNIFCHKCQDVLF